jgi:hypothetical protein
MRTTYRRTPRRKETTMKRTPVLMLLGATTAQADPDPGVETDRVSVPAPPTADQKLKKEWIRSDGTSVFF